MLKHIGLLTSGVVFLTACGDYNTEPEDQLTEEDTQFLAAQIDAAAIGLLDDIFGSSSGPAGAPALSHAPVTWTRTFERSRACHDGGTLTVAGTGTNVWDGEAVTYDVESSGTKTRVQSGGRWQGRPGLHLFRR